MQGEHNLPVCTLRTIFRASTCREGRVKEKLFRWFVKMGKKFGSEPCTRGEIVLNCNCDRTEGDLELTVRRRSVLGRVL